MFVFFNLLTSRGKRLRFFAMSNKFNNTGEQMRDSINHMRIKLL